MGVQKLTVQTQLHTYYVYIETHNDNLIGFMEHQNLLPLGEKVQPPMFIHQCPQSGIGNKPENNELTCKTENMKERWIQYGKMVQHRRVYKHHRNSVVLPKQPAQLESELGRVQGGCTKSEK